MENNALSFDKNLDVEFLQALYGDDTEHAMMMFQEFIISVPNMMKEIEESYQKNMIEDFRKKIHKVKPVFSFVGLTQLTKRAELLEAYCKESLYLKDLDGLYEDMKSHYDKNFLIVKEEATRLAHYK